MKKLKVTASCISVLFALPMSEAAFACDYPDKPNVPNGSTASKDEMLASQKEVRGYIEKLEEYQACIVEEEETARASLGELEPEEVQRREELVTKKYDAAYFAMKEAEAAFNSELKEYQSQEN